MYVDVIKMRDWYFTALGRKVADVLCEQIKSVCYPANKQQHILFLGYGIPFMKIWEEPHRVAAMPAQMGVMHWPPSGPSMTTLVWESDLPFPDNFFDLIIVSHALEFTSDLPGTLEECFRVLRPNGRVLAFAPNRTGVWSRREVSPLAMGRPYSAGQLESAFLQAEFMVVKSASCLFMPPSRREWVQKWSSTAERIGQSLGLPFGGVVWCLAQKDVLGGRAVRVEPLVKRPRPVLAPTS